MTSFASHTEQDPEGRHPDANRRPRLGCSACLLGEAVRYDGKHKRNAFMVESLGSLVEFVPVCPEVELGMGIPRAPIRLVENAVGQTRLMDAENGVDWTDRMIEYAAAKSDQIAELNLDGFILKSSSPSCALGRLEIIDAQGNELHREGTGFFAAALQARMPDLAVIEEDRLADVGEREDFLFRAFSSARCR